VHPWVGPLLVDPFFQRAALGGAIAALAVERDQLLRLDAEQAAAVGVRVVRQGVTKGMQGLGAELGHYAEGLSPSDPWVSRVACHTPLASMRVTLIL
jgi:hypothetical protein